MSASLFRHFLGSDTATPNLNTQAEDSLGNTGCDGCKRNTMIEAQRQSEIRHSDIRTLLDKVKRQNYEKYLVSLRIEKLRMFSGVTITFQFPVSALIGPNGGGKTTVLGACGCIYSPLVQQKIFLMSRFGDEGPTPWRIEYEIVDKNKNPNGTIRGILAFEEGRTWKNSETLSRNASFLGLMRTLPLSENPNFQLRGRLTKHTSTRYKRVEIATEELPERIAFRIRQEGERVLGKSLAEYRFYQVTATSVRLHRKRIREEVTLDDGRKAWIITNGPPREGKQHSLSQTMYVGKNEISTFSELNFGAGESSVLRIIADIESLPDGSLILIDEVENGLHPVAVRRLVEYLIDVAARKKVQVILTTHSDDALDPLPGEAIWACLDGKLQQGKLSVAALRAVSGRIETRLAIFVEDDFVRHWLSAIIRERLGEAIDEIGIHAVGGDGNAVKTHTGHLSNPAIEFRSLCYIDGDSKQKESTAEWIFRLPGGTPETTIFNDVLKNLSSNIALLTAACQRPLKRQSEVERAIKSVSQTNRDPHLIFVQVGELLGFLPEAIVRGAFLAVWIQENEAAVDAIASPIISALEKTN
jgi:predicted ATPase